MSTYRPLAAVVLAAGEGSRIRSGIPKVLHELCGRPMVLHVVDALAELPLERIVVVVGHGAERVTAYVTQTEDALDSEPLFYSGALNPPSAPVFHDGGLTGGSPRADFIGGQFDAHGKRFWAGVVKQLGPEVDGHNPTVGVAGTLRFSSATPASLP